MSKSLSTLEANIFIILNVFDMIKKVILIVFVMVFIHLNQAKSCDACGCASGNVGFGLISDYRYNFIQLGFFNMGFRSNHENNFTTVDQFRQWRVAMRYGIGKDARFNLNAFIPYITNVRETSIEKQRLSGFGDIRLEISYALFNNVSLGDNSFLYSEIGVGVKLPTGAYNAELHQDNLPDNFNIGNGSLSYKISSSTVLNFGSNGLSFSGNYLINGNTKDGYHFGNQLDAQLSYFRGFQVGESNLTPSIGMAYENIADDNYTTGNRVPETGGKGIFGTVSMNLKYKNILSGISYSMPISENYSGGIVKARGRLSCQISYLF
ncbi:MAG: hypothetical protein KDC16_01010 [Saprospiraceae bacterium]|nr:hypothetical protein [Saprospiraceae bacterium]